MKNWLKLVLVFVVFALVSVVIFFICRACGLTDIEKIRLFVERSGKWGIAVFFVFELFATTLFCFVPILDTAMVLLGCLLFGARVGFLVSFVVIFISSSLLFLLGDKCGEKLAEKFVGKAELEKAQDMVENKSKILLPLVFLLPCLPDDALCIAAGMTKMRYWYFAIITLIFRGLDVAIVCFFGSLNWASFSVVDWVLMINLLIVDVYLIFKLQNWFNNRKK